MMFENIFSNFQNKSKSKVSDSSVASKISESFSNIRCNIMDKTNSLSSYFSTNQQNHESQKSSFSSPTLMNQNKMNKTDSSYRHTNRSDYIQFNPIADYDEEESIVDRFTRVVNMDEDKQSLSRKFSFRRRNDREEIRRRLATGDADEFFGGDRPGRKPSLQARLQSGMNLQICFMNDQMSDTESPSSDSEPSNKIVSPMKQKQPSPLSKTPEPNKPSPTTNGHINGGIAEMSEVDVLVCVARLQTEARTALAQASDLAHLQMQMERQRRSVSPITEMLRNTLHKVGVVFPQDRRRVSRQMLTDMNIAQLQVIANDLHAQIETLNESLVKFLMERDELHMSQDSMLVDIEDLTRYLGAKENTFKEDISFNNNLHESKLPANRTARLVRK